ncbi:hypothetical protein HanRHA438_Chr14g0631891 [Helianthus annuus]|nr:hypothetical protein HanRHA438_Chr14g0631891 [Helianthus annuus]
MTAVDADDSSPIVVVFDDPKWVSGKWDLKQFQKGGATDRDVVAGFQTKNDEISG